MPIELKVHQFKSLKPRKVVKQILHVLQNHATCPKYLDLIVLLCKVTGKHISEALYIRQLLMVDHTPPSNSHYQL